MSRQDVDVAVDPVADGDADRAPGVVERLDGIEQNAETRAGPALRRAIVDQQQVPRATDPLRGTSHGARLGGRGRLAGLEFARPFPPERLAVAQHEEIPPRCRTAGGFTMEGAGARLEESPVSRAREPETQVNVLVVGREVTRVEPSQRVPRLPAHQERAGRAVIDGPHEVVGIGFDRVAAAHAERRTVAPCDGACFLDRAVREQDQASDRTGVGMPISRFDERLQPSRKHLDVVVQEDQELSRGLRSPRLHPPPKPRFVAEGRSRTGDEKRFAAAARCAAEGPLATTTISCAMAVVMFWRKEWRQRRIRGFPNVGITIETLGDRGPAVGLLCLSSSIGPRGVGSVCRVTRTLCQFSALRYKSDAEPASS